ncbi:putative multidrug resistance protein fnx1 [Hypomontagnella monticulosa]|nr:putative multidrug resistance protein fnx1 [Hypomontagnella monticulosa]
MEKVHHKVHEVDLSIALEEDSDEYNYITGWKLHCIFGGLGLGLFLVNFEITIVSTALVSITNSLNDFSRGSWIITGYMITYIAGLVLWAKLSDLFGRKSTCVVSFLIFSAFSAGCGAAQTIVQLIVCRVFQGIGGSGIYALGIIMLYELVPPPKYPLYTTLVTILVALANSLGPLFGGLITEGPAWRWVFLLNVPTGAIAGLILLIILPNNFPNQGRRITRKPLDPRAIDFTGAFLMLAALALLVTGLEEAASLLAWTSTSTIVPLCASLVAWIAFLVSQWYASRPTSITQPVFPWTFCQDRVIGGLLLNSFATGAVSITCIFQLPLRYQTAVGVSPLQAGLRLIPFSVCGPLGAMIAAIFSKGERIAPIYFTLLGSIFQIVGLVFMSQGPASNPDWTALYGLEVVVGLGFGFCVGTASLLTPFVLEKRDLAVGTAAVTQFRFLGSAAVISLITAVGNSWTREALSNSLTAAQLQSLFRSTAIIGTLPTDLQTTVRQTFVESFNLQMRIVLGFAVFSVFTVLLMWKKAQIKVP